MISLKTNSKGEYVTAAGIRTRESTVYTPGQTEDFTISRSKLTDFRKCKKCFYLDRVRGLVYPSTPGWTLNARTDQLLKKEFDECREREIAHRIMEEHGLEYVVPFKHEEMDHWRDSMRHGLRARFKSTNIILHGGVDDIWWDTTTKEVIVVDYKSQANKKVVNPETYLYPTHRKWYAEQMDFYAYLLQEMGFDVSGTSYFYVCNEDGQAPGFHGKLTFQETLVPYEWSSDWIESSVKKMIKTLNSTEVPSSNISCENCAYARQRQLTRPYVKKAEKGPVSVEHEGDLDHSDLTSAQGLELPDRVTGHLHLGHLSSTKGLKLPEYVGGYLWLDSLRSAKGLKLPEYVAGGLSLNGLTSAEGVTLPKHVGVDLWLDGLATAEGLELPKHVGRGLSLNALTSVKDLKLPEQIKGWLGLAGLGSADGLQFPRDVEWSVDLDRLQSVRGLRLPNRVGGDLHLFALDESEYDQEIHGPGELGGGVLFRDPYLAELEYLNEMLLDVMSGTTRVLPRNSKERRDRAELESQVAQITAMGGTVDIPID
jgi:hypothetical protein